MADPQRSYFQWLVPLLCGALSLAALPGCQLVLPSVRTVSDAPTQPCDAEVGSDQAPAESQSDVPAEPSVHPPHSKFHPVPTRPVFHPPSIPAAMEQVPVPSPEEQELAQEPDNEPKHLDLRATDELPAPQETTDETPTTETEEDGEESAETKDLLETSDPNTVPVPIHPASVELRWADDEAP